MPNDPSALTQLGWQAWVTGAVLLLTLAALIRELATPAQILFGALVVLLVTGVVQPDSALVGFSNPAMLTVGALFVVAGAVRKTGALGFLRHLMMPRSKRSVPALARIMLPSSFLSCFMNNTPIVAFLTPMVQKWTQKAGTPASKLLIPLSYATILGGMGTLIGTSTNLVVSSLLAKEGHGGFGMFELAWVGVPAAFAGFVYFATVGHRLLPSTEDQTESHTRASRPYQFDLRVPDDSALVGQSVQKAGLRKLEDAFLAHVHRRGEIIGPVTPNQVVEAGDILTFFGETKRMDRLLRGGKLTRVVEAPNGDASQQPELPLYEAVVSPDSTVVGRSLSTADFRDRFQAVVLGIHRAGQRVRGPLGRIPVEAGDLLLIEAGPNFEERWSQSGEFYLVAPLEREPARAPGSQAVKVLAILVAMMTIVALGLMPIISAAFAAAILVVLTGSLAPGDARRSVDLNVLIVIASAFGLGQAIQDTGLAAWFAAMLVDWTSGLGILGALLLIYISTNLLTEILTNSVSAVLVFPVGMAVAAGIGLDPRAVAVTIAVAASASFATPIGYQTNLMVMGPGGYRFRDYLRVGIPLNLLIMTLALWIIPRVWN